MKQETAPLLTVIMPVYNAEYSVGNALSSILSTPRKYEIEIIVVDDCSKDGSKAIVERLQKTHKNITLLTMPQNSGSPSAPRNLAIEYAKGEYVTFVDDDDRVNAANMMKMLDHARDNNHDIVKGYLYNVMGEKKSIANRLHKLPITTKEAIHDMVAHQSTTSDFFVRRDVLIKNNIRYPTDLRIGEDTVFFFETLAHSDSVSYADYYYWYHSIVAIDPLNPSSTQQCGDREVNHQITAWERSEEILESTGLSYYKLRLHIGFRNLLISTVRFSTGLAEETFGRLHAFALLNQKIISGKMNLHERYEELYQAILKGDYPNYLGVAKCRLLINGYDLKFVLPLVPYLERIYNVKVDEWTGHNTHDKKRSEKLAKWADIFWCEWLLGNAVFYSKLKNKNQRICVRCHRFEIERDFGSQIDLSNVDMFLTVSFFYFELFSQRFSLPREIIRLLPNYVEESIYNTEKSENAKYHIGLIGSLPKRKGLHKALKLLLMLREKEPRFTLFVMGQQAKDVSWIRNNPSEFEYYENCDKLVSENNLSDAVVYGGFIERSQVYRDIGYVLSLSDDEVIPESFHLAPAEGACAGSMGLLLKWRGVEFIYPNEFIFDSLEDMANEILRASSDEDYFEEKSSKFRDFILENYSMGKFLTNLNGYVKQLFLFS